jgi:hypothetical protein
MIKSLHVTNGINFTDISYIMFKLEAYLLRSILIL